MRALDVYLGVACREFTEMGRMLQDEGRVA